MIYHMAITPKLHWTVKLSGGKKLHFTSSDEWGEPYNTTICGKPCGPDLRVSARKGVDSLADGTLCAPCAKLFTDAIGGLRSLFIQDGNSGEEATAIADKMLNIKRAMPK
jgi:hypothetical protein